MAWLAQDIYLNIVKIFDLNFFIPSSRSLYLLGLDKLPALEAPFHVTCPSNVNL